MRFQKEEEENVAFEDVKILGETSSGKAIRCKFPKGYERLVPVSQIVEFPEIGEMGDLVITGWLAGKWEEEGEPEPPEVFEVPDAVVLRVSGKGIQVKAKSINDGEPIWLPKNGVTEDSEAKDDGDTGKLTLHMWCAKMKGFTGDASTEERDIGQDTRDSMNQGFLRNRTNNPENIPDDDVPF